MYYNFRVSFYLSHLKSCNFILFCYCMTPYGLHFCWTNFLITLRHKIVYWKYQKIDSANMKSQIMGSYNNILCFHNTCLTKYSINKMWLNIPKQYQVVKIWTFYGEDVNFWTEFFRFLLWNNICLCMLSFNISHLSSVLGHMKPLPSLFINLTEI